MQVIQSLTRWLQESAGVRPRLPSRLRELLRRTGLWNRWASARLGTQPLQFNFFWGRLFICENSRWLLRPLTYGASPARVHSVERWGVINLRQSSKKSFIEEQCVIEGGNRVVRLTYWLVLLRKEKTTGGEGGGHLGRGHGVGRGEGQAPPAPPGPGPRDPGPPLRPGPPGPAALPRAAQRRAAGRRPRGGNLGRDPRSDPLRVSIWLATLPPPLALQTPPPPSSPPYHHHHHQQHHIIDVGISTAALAPRLKHICSSTLQ